MSNSDFRTLPRHALRRRLVASSFAALLIILGGVGHALAQSDEDDELPDTKFFKSMLRGFGLRNGQENAGINYQERPPLVVPPTRDLPPPQADDAARRNAAWPQDQDDKRRREARRKKDTRVFSWEDLSRQLSPNEMRTGTTTASPKDAALRKRSGETPEEADRQYKPSELGYVGGLFGDFKGFFTGNNKAETATFEDEPPRSALTDPPSGYRSPSPLEPYGLRADKPNAKAMTQEERATQGLDK
jgi:hypothetical protein